MKRKQIKTKQMSNRFNTEDKHIGVVGGGVGGGGGSGGYGLRSLPQRRRRQSLSGGGGGDGDGESEEMHRELLRKEIEKIRRAREREREHEREHERKQENVVQENVVRVNSHDITGEEFQIVCEELWIDFKLWVDHHKNLTNSASIFWSAITRNLYAILFVASFAVLFRWYVGAGRDACSYGIGYGVFSFMCEVLRYLGEIVVILLLSIIGFCVGLLPFVIGVIICEFDSAFPREGREEYGDEDYDDADHLKKE